jgi:hypothetical protein
MDGVNRSVMYEIMMLCRERESANQNPKPEDSQEGLSSPVSYTLCTLFLFLTVTKNLFFSFLFLFVWGVDGVRGTITPHMSAL